MKGKRHTAATLQWMRIAQRKASNRPEKLAKLRAAALRRYPPPEGREEEYKVFRKNGYSRAEALEALKDVQR